MQEHFMYIMDVSPVLKNGCDHWVTPGTPFLSLTRRHWGIHPSIIAVNAHIQCTVCTHTHTLYIYIRECRYTSCVCDKVKASSIVFWVWVSIPFSHEPTILPYLHTRRVCDQPHAHTNRQAMGLLSRNVKGLGANLPFLSSLKVDVSIR